MSSDSSKLKTILTDHFGPLLNKHGNSHQSVNWGSQASQNLRFKTLLEPFLHEPDGTTLLDVGCGLGHLYSYIKEQNLNFEYHGIDAITAMIEKARENNPEIDSRFEVAELDKKEGEKFDIVIASGIFYLACDESRMQKEISRLFAMAKRGVAFNSLSSWASEKESHEFYADPASVINFCRTLTPLCILRHDYMPHDFTVQLFKQ